MICVVSRVDGLGVQLLEHLPVEAWEVVGLVQRHDGVPMLLRPLLPAWEATLILKHPSVDGELFTAIDAFRYQHHTSSPCKSYA